jgi:hypothetical protein
MNPIFADRNSQPQSEYIVIFETLRGVKASRISIIQTIQPDTTRIGRDPFLSYLVDNTPSPYLIYSGFPLRQRRHISPSLIDLTPNR